MATKKFQELIVWQKAHQFVLSICKYYSDVYDKQVLLDEITKMLESYRSKILASNS